MPTTPVVPFCTTKSRLENPLALFEPAARVMRQHGHPKYARALRQRQYDQYKSKQAARKMLSNYVRIKLCPTASDADARNRIPKYL